MGPIWGPPVSYRSQMGPMLAPWTLLSGSSATLSVCDTSDTLSALPGDYWTFLFQGTVAIFSLERDDLNFIYIINLGLLRRLSVYWPYSFVVALFSKATISIWWPLSKLVDMPNGSYVVKTHSTSSLYIPAYHIWIFVWCEFVRRHCY